MTTITFLPRGAENLPLLGKCCVEGLPRGIGGNKERGATDEGPTDDRALLYQFEPRLLSES